MKKGDMYLIFTKNPSNLELSAMYVATIGYAHIFFCQDRLVITNNNNVIEEDVLDLLDYYEVMI